MVTPANLRSYARIARERLANQLTAARFASEAAANGSVPDDAVALFFAVGPENAYQFEQWQRPLEKKTPFMERWHFVNIGAAVHNLLPGNLGDVTRANHDFHLQADSPALKLGFRPFDYSKAGVYGEAGWINLGKSATFPQLEDEPPGPKG